MNTNLVVMNTSILDSEADIILMSANPSLLAGSGVSGGLHKAAGIDPEKHTKLLGRGSVGQAVITPAIAIQAQYIVHAVCPHYYDEYRGEATQLCLAYQNALTACENLPDVSSVAFFSMGTGVYKWPIHLS